MDQDDRTEYKSPHRSKIAKDFYCCKCSRTVKTADEDGRAGELADAALYMCPACAEKEQKKSDIKKMGSYKILFKLGRGGATAVYEAWHEPTGRVGALRRILPECTGFDWARALFEHEIKVMQPLVHPHVVRLIDHTLGEEPLYSVYEYLPGGDLHTSAHRGNVHVPELCRMICQVLEGLEYIHQKGLVHRDIKPHNMLLTSDGRCKLGDFNLAKKMGDPEVLKTDKTLGPLGFTSPEQVLNFEKVKPPADVYSAGVSLYYVLTRGFPIKVPSIKETMKALFKENAPRDLVEAMKDERYRKRIFSEHWEVVKKSILKDDRVPIQSYRKDLPSELAEIVDRSVMRDETRRFGSARELRDALAAYLSMGVER